LFKRHRFPADIIHHAVWLYFHFTLTFRDVVKMLAARGIEISYETIRCSTIKFGLQIARNLKRKRQVPSPRWHLDEVVCNIGGKHMYLWCAVDVRAKCWMSRCRSGGANGGSAQGSKLVVVPFRSGWRIIQDVKL